MTSYLAKPVRTAWDAARDLFEQACRVRDAAMWDRAYRLWIYASVSRAPGQFFPASTYQREWLP